MPKRTADQIEDFDISGRIGPLFTIPGDDWDQIRSPEATDGLAWKAAPEVPMFSYDRPAYKLWNALARALYARGWPEERINEWLRSKEPRWALDGDLGEQIEALGRAYAESIPDDWTV